MMNTDRLSKLDFKRLDRKLSSEEKQEWEMIYASFRSGSVLTGTVVGNDVTKLSGHGEVLSLTIINYRVKIMIPYNEVWYDDEKSPPEHVLRSMAGSQIDYVITGIDRKAGCCTASRRKALEIRRKSFLKLKPQIGKRVECDIIAVGRSKALCSCNGFDVSLKTRDISFASIPDLREYLHTGEKHEAVITAFDSDTKTLSISIKDAKPHPFDGAESRHPVNSRRASFITGKYSGGVFCRIEEGLDCLCKYLPEQSDSDFHIGDRVIIVIKKYNYERKLIFGRILARW